MKQFGIMLLCLACMACNQPNGSTTNVATPPARDLRVSQLSKTKSALVKFYRPMKEQEGDWLQSHPENGETFEQYVASSPTLPTVERKKIYIQPMGTFSADQLAVIRTTADYVMVFYNLPVVLLDQQYLDKIPNGMERVQYPHNRQIRTSYFLDDILPGMVPSDGAALICLTNRDLYQGDTSNYVFGQASPEKRIGVWSLWRLGKSG